MKVKESILILGANGQIGSELTVTLRAIYGSDQVIATDIKPALHQLDEKGPYYQIDVLDTMAIAKIIKTHQVKQVYLLAAMLSATAEQKIKSAWKLNMDGLIGILDLAKELQFKLFWPSSIAVFGPNTPREHTPQFTVMEPSTIYGISKQAGERWCQYYFEKFNVDVRSLRYPGLIGYKTAPGGGTTDYAVHIFHEAVKHTQYTSFLSEHTMLPMMYMPDALKATIGIMNASAAEVKIRSSYNLAAISFTPAQLAAEIQKHLPDFTIAYQQDIRQSYADSWPQSIDDSPARQHWNWKHDYDLNAMTQDMLTHIREMVAI